jgi:hypothetical protein
LVGAEVLGPAAGQAAGQPLAVGPSQPWGDQPAAEAMALARGHDRAQKWNLGKLSLIDATAHLISRYLLLTLLILPFLLCPHGNC